MGDFGSNGAQALGNVVGVLAALESLRRPGGIGDYFANRIAVQSDPDSRAALVDSPFTAGFFGTTGGHRVPTAAAPELQRAGLGRNPGVEVLGPGESPTGAPSVADQWMPNLPPIGPNNLLKQKLAMVDMALKLGELGLNQQKTTNAADFAKLFQGGGAPGAGAGPGGMALTGLSVGADGQPRLSYGAPPATTVSGGSINPKTGQPYQAGEKTPSGKIVDEVKVDKKQTASAAVRDEQVSNAQAVLDVIPALREKSQELLYQPASPTRSGPMQALLNEFGKGYQQKVTVPNALASGQAPEFQTAVQKIIPLIRAAAVGTKGLRITNAEFEREGGPLTHPENYSAPELKAYLDKVEADMQDIVKGTAGGVPTGTPKGPAMPVQTPARTPYDPAQRAADLQLLGLGG